MIKSFVVVQYAENGCKVDSPVQFHAMPQASFFNPMIQAEWMIIRLMEHWAVTYHSVPLVRVMGSDIEHITCKAVLRCNVAAHLRIHVGDMC